MILLIALKSIAAVYVSLYLILPACMCQLLAAFGCDIHGHSTATADQESPALSEAVIYVAPICHCDTPVDKTAEADRSESQGIEHFDLLFAIIDEPGNQKIARPANAGHGSRAPPAQPVWSRSSYTGVYLI